MSAVLVRLSRPSTIGASSAIACWEAAVIPASSRELCSSQEATYSFPPVFGPAGLVPLVGPGGLEQARQTSSAMAAVAGRRTCLDTKFIGPWDGTPRLYKEYWAKNEVRWA